MDHGSHVSYHSWEYGGVGKVRWLSNLEPSTPRRDFRKTGLICTIGPRTNSLQTLKELRTEGLNIVRLNFSHGDYDFHRSAIENVREAQRTQPGRPVAIALDTKGPEIRTGIVRGAEVFFEAGKEVTVTTDDKYAKACDGDYIYVDYKNITKAIKPGQVIFIDDGTLSFVALEVLDETSIRVHTRASGTLYSRKAVNVPGADLDLPFLSDKDKKDLSFGLEHDVDMVFASFTHSAEDILNIKRELGEKGENIQVIAKIEDRRGLNACSEIIAVADGVMVARGALGIELPHSEVFIVQKKIISLCNMAGKPVICATQMLESMIQNPRATRAEISDVGNAIMDGADCVMLSSETARGAYPVQAVREMHAACLIAEDTIPYLLHFAEMCGLLSGSVSVEEACAMCAVRTSLDLDAAAIIVLSATGETARLVSKYRPKCPIFMVSRNPFASRHSHLSRGVYPFVYDGPRGEWEKWNEDLEMRVEWTITEAKRLQMLADDVPLVVVQGWKPSRGHTNTISLRKS